MKTIIALWGNADCGKTSSIIWTYNKLFYPESLPLGEDFFKIRDKNPYGKIGFSSLGDPGYPAHYDNLESMVKANCDIILTACRTRGTTVDNITSLAQQYGYRVIWMSPFSIAGGANYDVLNSMTAEAIISVLNNINSI